MLMFDKRGARRTVAPVIVCLFAGSLLLSGCGQKASPVTPMPPPAAPRATGVASAPMTPAGQVQHHNWVQRHPTATSVGAGVLTHHALKVAAKNDKAQGKKLNWAERASSISPRNCSGDM